MAGYVIVSIVVVLTMMIVFVSERMSRDLVIEESIKEGTQTLESELKRVQQSLESIKRLSAVQETEILQLRKQLSDRAQT